MQTKGADDRRLSCLFGIAGNAIFSLTSLLSPSLGKGLTRDRGEDNEGRDPSTAVGMTSGGRGTGIYHVMMLALSYEPDGTPGGRNYGITDMTQEERWLAKYNEVMEEYKRKNQYE